MRLSLSWVWTTPGSRNLLGSAFTASISRFLTLALACGAISAFSQKQNPERMAAVMKTGRAMRGRLWPAILMERISLSAERRPKTSMTAARKLNGIVNISENGSTLSMNSKTSMGEGCLPTKSGRASLKMFPSMKTPLRIATANRVVVNRFFPI